MQYKIENNIKHEWKLLLQNNTKLNNLNAINNFLIASRRSEKNIFPKINNIFRSLSFSAPKDINVVIVGQDPYHSYGQANGLAFSVNEGIKLPPSLKNNYKDIEKAKKENKSPKQIIDHYDQLIRNSFEAFGISFDNYSRTSLAVHRETAQEIFKDLHQKNIFEEKDSEQLFDPEAQQFLADRFIKGTCPICQNTEAYGDQCENCGSSLSSSELLNPKSTISGSKPELRKTKHWYLPLDRYEKFLEEWIIKGHKLDWKPNVYGQVKSWIDNGLKARAVTRDLDWGIPVPVKGGENKVLYVWFDAPIGYISSTKEWATSKGIDLSLIHI